MIHHLLSISTLLVAANTFAQPALIERPLYRQFKNGAEPRVTSYVLFGTLANGTPAITKNSKGHAFFYARHLMINQELKMLVASGIECKTGTHYTVAVGPIEAMTAVKKEEMVSIQQAHPESLPTYRKVCEAVDLPIGKW